MCHTEQGPWGLHSHTRSASPDTPAQAEAQPHGGGKNPGELKAAARARTGDKGCMGQSGRKQVLAAGPESPRDAPLGRHLPGFGHPKRRGRAQEISSCTHRAGTASSEMAGNTRKRPGANIHLRGEQPGGGLSPTPPTTSTSKQSSWAAGSPLCATTTAKVLCKPKHQVLCKLPSRPRPGALGMRHKVTAHRPVPCAHTPEHPAGTACTSSSHGPALCSTRISGSSKT